MGIVYLAEDPKSRRRVAVKVIRHELAEDHDFRKRFKREIDAITHVSGECTAAIIEADASAARPFLVTEYIDGPALDALVGEEGPLTGDRAVALALGLAEALNAIHSVGLVHRDLKPSNVLISRGGPKVIDFGIARAADATSITRTGVALGTPAWMAPEQAKGEPAGSAADIFAWGAVVAFACSGRAPFGEGPSDALLYRVVHGAPDLEGVHPDLADVVRLALSKAPNERPSALQLVETLLHTLEADTGGLLATQVNRALEATWAESGREPRTDEGQERRRRVLAWGAAGILLVGGGLGWVATRDSSPSRTADGASTRDRPATKESVDEGATEADLSGEVVYPDEVVASDTAPRGEDAAGAVIDYDVTNIFDGNPGTAWRVEGIGVGVTLELRFDSPVSISQVGLIPGYAKVDPTDGTDRFKQGRLVSAVELSTEEGASIEASFRPSRSVQFVDVQQKTSVLTLTITETTAPGEQGYDYTAISELVIRAESSKGVRTTPPEPESGLTADDVCFTSDVGVQGCFWVGAATAELIGQPFGGYGGDPGVFGSSPYAICLASASYTLDVLVGNVPGTSIEASEAADRLAAEGLARDAAVKVNDFAVEYQADASNGTDASAAESAARKIESLCGGQFPRELEG